LESTIWNGDRSVKPVKMGDFGAISESGRVEPLGRGLRIHQMRALIYTAICMAAVHC